MTQVSDSIINSIGTRLLQAKKSPISKRLKEARLEAKLSQKQHNEWRGHEHWAITHEDFIRDNPVC